MSEMRSDLMAVLEAASAITRDLHELRTFADQALRELDSPLNKPAHALTEDAIVAALKADPAMAGRVVATWASLASIDSVREAGESARDYAQQLYSSHARRSGLQSLAVALAAASYRG